MNILHECPVGRMSWLTVDPYQPVNFCIDNVFILRYIVQEI
jgi:hypothetical protein